jgi:hypothetical protein
VKKTKQSHKRKKDRWLAVGALVASTAFSSRMATPVFARERPERTNPSLTRDFMTTRFGLGSVNVALTAARNWDVPDDPQQTTIQRFDIPPGPLGDVLAAFEAATKVKVTVTVDSIRTLQSPGVSGLHTAERALEQILAGTGISYRFTAPDAVTLRLEAASEFVEVQGNAAPLSVRTFTEPVRDIPQTIEVIPSEVFQAQGVTSLRDVLRNVPGITFQAGRRWRRPAGRQLLNPWLPRGQ